MYTRIRKKDFVHPIISKWRDEKKTSLTMYENIHLLWNDEIISSDIFLFFCDILSCTACRQNRACDVISGRDRRGMAAIWAHLTRTLCF